MPPIQELSKRLLPGVSLLLTLMLFCHSGALAQQPPVVNPDSALVKLLTAMSGVPLSLETARQQALKNATDVRRAEAQYLAARGTVRREKGAFDPEIFFNLQHNVDKLPTASFFAGASVLSTRQTRASTGLRMSLTTGTELQATLNATRFETNSSFAFLNPQYTTFGNLSLRQSLLGGFRATGRRELSRAEKDLQAARARYDQAVVSVAAEAERRYWDLYAAERDLAVQQLIRDRAASLLHEAELRAKSGLVGPNQVANARVFLAEQDFLLLDREETLDRLSDELASLMGVRPADEAGRYKTVDEPPAQFPLQPVEDLLRKAREANLTLTAARQAVAARRIEAGAARWNALPSVDVFGSLGGNGLAGDPQAVIFGSDTLQASRGGNLGDALREVTRRDFPSWSVGVEISVPIGLRSGLGERDRLRAEVMQSEQEYLAAERSLEEQVRASHRELQHGLRRLEAARAGVDAAQEQVRIGQIEFRNGRTTAFELVRLGADLAVAQQRYSQALVRSAKAAATLKQLTSGGYPAATSP